MVARPPTGFVPRGNPNGRHVRAAVLQSLVVDGDPSSQQLPREEQRVPELERLEQQLAKRRLVGGTRHLLDQPAGDAEGGVVVRNGLARPRQLAEPGHRLDVSGKRVVSVAGGPEEVAVPAGCVVQQLQDRYRRCRLLVPDLEVGHVGADRRVQVDAPRPTRRAIAVAVYVLVVDPQRKSVRSSTGSGFSMLVTPWKACCGSAVEENPDRNAGNLQLLGERGDDILKRSHLR